MKYRPRYYTLNKLLANLSGDEQSSNLLFLDRGFLQQEA